MDIVREYEDKLRNECLTGLIEEVNASEDYEAICLINSGAGGYNINCKLIQLKDGRFLTNTKTDFGEETGKAQLKLNLIEELCSLRKEYPKLRVKLPWDNSLARYITLYLAVKNDGDWLICQPSLAGQPFRNTTVDRINTAIFR